MGRSWRAGACQVCHATAILSVPVLNIAHVAGASFNWPSPSPSSTRSGTSPSRALPQDPCANTPSPPISQCSQFLRSFQRLGLQCPVGVLLYPCLPALQSRSCRDAFAGTVHLDAARLSWRKRLLTRAVGAPTPSHFARDCRCRHQLHQRQRPGASQQIRGRERARHTYAGPRSLLGVLSPPHFSLISTTGTLFTRARSSKPCIVFFDELDSLCPKRSGDGTNANSERVCTSK